MGLRQRSDYTAFMTSGDPAAYESGDLLIDAVSGQVKNLHEACVRLGPVKMKVLLALLRRPGEVVGRSEIFDAVWGNQVVSDDALTRCVSDIRADLKKLSGRDDLIETLPKRGYRWTAPVRDTAERSPGGVAAAPEDSRLGVLPRGARSRIRPGRLLALGIAWLLALAAGASLIVWAIDQVTVPGPAVIAVLPIAADPTDQSLAILIENQLMERLVRSDQVEVLSRSAVESRPANPFPFFYFEFGARWLLESELRKTQTQTLLSIAVVDARTGIVLLQSSAPLRRDKDAAPLSIEEIVGFIESQNGRPPAATQ